MQCAVVVDGSCLYCITYNDKQERKIVSLVFGVDRLFHKLQSEYNLRIWVWNLGPFGLKNRGPKYENSGPDFGRLLTWREKSLEWNKISSTGKVRWNEAPKGRLSGGNVMGSCHIYTLTINGSCKVPYGTQGFFPIINSGKRFFGITKILHIWNLKNEAFDAMPHIYLVDKLL